MTSYFLNNIRRLRSASENFPNKIISLIVAGLILFSSSCEEPASLVGSKLLPESDYVTIESSLLKVESYTMYSDSIESMMPAVSYLGMKSDPWFGSTTAEFVSQLRLDSPWEDTFYNIDSVKMFMRFLTVEGNTSAPHFLRMSEISEVIYSHPDTIYYSGQTIGLTGYTIPDIPLPVLKPDTINLIELDIDPSFAEYVLRDKNYLQYGTDYDFRDYFKGLHFQIISPEDPIFVSLSVKSANTYTYSNYFVIYMNNGLGVNMKYTLRIDAVTPNAVFNIYRHDYTAADPDKELKHINDLNYTDTLSYAQAFNGVFTKLLLSDLDSIKNSPEMKRISVNKARLKMPVYYDGYGYRRSTLPPILYLRYLKADGKKYLIPESSAFYNGTADTSFVSPADDVYNLNIATFVQNYLADSTGMILPELELFVYPTERNNVILRANDSYRPVKFEFTYTRF